MREVLDEESDVARDVDGGDDGAGDRPEEAEDVHAAEAGGAAEGCLPGFLGHGAGGGEDVGAGGGEDGGRDVGVEVLV